jgi:hypothetical protein
MATDTALIEKREELKRRLAAGEYRTLIDALLDGTGLLIQKITRRSRHISPWFSSAIMYLVVLLVGLTILVSIGSKSVLRDGPGVIAILFLMNLLLGYLSIPGLVVGNLYIHYVFTIFHNDVLDAVQSIADVDDFEDWLKNVCNQKNHLLLSLVVGVPVGMFFMYGYSGIGFDTRISVTIFLLSIGNFMFLYLLLYMVLLSARIGRYELKLYTANPSSSEVIAQLANLLSKFVYLVALYASYLALVFLMSGILVIGAVVVLVLLLFWVPIISMFFINQNSLSNIIQKAKWKTLNDIQKRVEQLHASKKLGDSDTMETINRLMDYHDRIKDSSNSTINLGTVLNLVNSLLLPLLALTLANLDKILDLVR